jgi:hypothetical protein
MATDIPEWAIRRALIPFLEAHPTTNWTSERILAEMERPRGSYGFAALVLAYAKLIAEHEEAPVDPLLIEARKLVAARYTGHDKDLFAEMTLSGEDDETDAVQNALAALRRGVELGKSGEAS